MKWLAALLIVLLASRAEAHPHVWVNYSVRVEGTEAGITALHFDWKFDAFFSSTLIHDLEIKSKDKLTDAEIKRLHDKAFAALKDQNYMVNLQLNGKVSDKPVMPEAFSAYRTGRQIHYTFTVKLPAPTKDVLFAVFDNTYYVDVWPEEKNAITPPQTGGITCKPSVKEVPQPMWGTQKIQEIRCQ